MDLGLGGLLERLGESGLVELLRPVEPYNRSTLLTPLVTAAAVAALFSLAVVAVGALAAALLALVAVYFLLSEVFGYELSVAL